MVNEELSVARTWELARAILRYLEDCPDAKDSVDGIAQWWLRREWSERLLGDVERAVSLLLSEGFLLESCLQGQRPYYGLNPKRRAAISRLLHGGVKRPGL